MDGDNRVVRGEVLKGHLEAILLAALARGQAHGYAIVETAAQVTNGEMKLPEGTVYPALQRLENAKLCTSKWSTAKGRKRRVYQLTKEGERELARRREDWSRFRKAMENLLEDND